MKIKQLEEGLKALELRVSNLEKEDGTPLEKIIEQLQYLSLEIQLLKSARKPWYKFW